MPLIWPAELLEKEVTLRCRRLLLRGISDLGIDLGDARFDARAALEHGFGQQLTDVFVRSLPPDAAALLTSEVLFGRWNAMFRRKLPFLLANGHTAHGCLANLIGAEAQSSADSARAAALFHLAASVSDVLIDALHLAGPLEELLPPAALEELLAQESVVPLMPLPSVENGQRELALFRGLILAFSSAVARLKMSPGVKRNLTTWVSRGYRAQLSSASAPHLRTPDVCMTRVVAPAMVIGILAAHRATVSQRRLVRALSHRIGELIGRVDDLVDVADDAATLHPNLVLHAAAKAGRATLHEILDCGAIEACVERVLDLLEEIHTLVGDASGEPASKSELFLWLLTYLRGDLKLMDVLRAA